MATWQAARLLLVMWLSAFSPFVVHAQTATPHPERLIFHFADSINALLGNTAHGHNIDECTTTLYLKHNMFTKRRGPIVRYIPNMPRLERGMHHYQTEVQMRIQFHPHGETDCKIVACNSNAPYLQPERFGSWGRFSFQIYQPKLFIDRLLNPFSRRNSIYYKYTVRQTMPTHDAKPTTMRVDIRPRFNNDQLAKGYADINMLTGAVVHFELSFHHQLQNITVNAQIGQEGYLQLVPTTMRTISDFKLFGNRVYEICDIYPTYNFKCPTATLHNKKRQYDLTQQCVLRIDTTHVNLSAAYFDTIRPVALHDDAELIIAQIMQQQAKTDLSDPISLQKDSAIHTTDKHAIINEQAKDILLSSHKFNITNNGNANLELPPIITPSMIQWSGNKGLSLRTRLRFNFNKQHNYSDNKIEISPSVGYSFKQKQIYWSTPLLWYCAPAINGKLHFEAGGGARNYNNKQAEELRHKLQGYEHYDSLQNVIDNYGFHDYRDTHLQTDFSLSPMPGIVLTSGFRYHRRTLVEWNDLAKSAGLAHYLSAIGPRIQIEWTPAQYYYRQGKRRIPLYSRYPTFIFCYERGYDLEHGDTHFERIEGDVRFRIALYAMRTLYVRAGGGFFTQRGKDCFLDYDFFRFNYMPQEWNDELCGEFQLLSSRWYNESRYYAHITTSYESPMLFLSRISLLSRAIQKERLYFNILSVRSLGIYTELGYGISTHLFDAGLFTGISRHNTIKFGCKIAFHLFEN